jgi:hypothetical protein
MEAKIGMMLPEDRKGFCPKDFGESVDFWLLEFWFQTSQFVWENKSDVLIHQICVNLHGIVETNVINFVYNFYTIKSWGASEGSNPNALPLFWEKETPESRKEGDGYTHPVCYNLTLFEG